MFKKIHFPKIDSTHKWARRELCRLANDHYIISAGDQTDGVGRKGDRWFSSPNENITCTLLFPAPKIDLQYMASLLAYSAIKMLEELYFKALFKWPNDLRLNGKKVSGVMCDIQNDRAILSIGLNVNMQNVSNIDQPATSLYLESQKKYDVGEVQERLLSLFTQDLELFRKEGFTPFFESFISHLEVKGTIQNLPYCILKK